MFLIALCNHGIYNLLVMLITNVEAIVKFLKKNDRARRPMSRWMQIAEHAEWQDIVDARKVFPSADFIRGTPYTAFNIHGNEYRLIAIVAYKQQAISIVELLSHAEYSLKYT